MKNDIVDLSSIPTVEVEETIVLVINGVEYGAEEVFSQPGSRCFVYTDAFGTMRVLRIQIT